MKGGGHESGPVSLRRGRAGIAGTPVREVLRTAAALMATDGQFPQDSGLWSTVVGRNRRTRELWESYAEHRGRVTRLLTDAADNQPPAERSLILLGAGNCLDVDLAELLRVFRRVTLIDLDAEALQSGLILQRIEPGRVQCVAPLDLAAPLSGIDRTRLSSRTVTELTLQELAGSLKHPSVVKGRVVASLCLLSQILEYAATLLPSDDPDYPQLVRSLRHGHLMRMLQFLEPGGEGLLITDLVSSDTEPRLPAVSEPDLPRLLKDCLNRGNFFSGLNPAVVRNDLTTLPEFRGQCASVRVKDPWRWRMGPRMYAVYAVTFRRCADPVADVSEP